MNKIKSGIEKDQNNFKGYPLIDFMQENFLGIEDILSKPSLMEAVSAFTRTYQPDNDSRRPSTTTNDNSHCEPTSTDINIGKGVNKFPGSTIFPGTVGFYDVSADKPSFEDSIKEFLDGLYLGKFESSVFQPIASKPPLNYIFEIGFNTDKITGFIVENPLDTLITFEPRKPLHPYEKYKKPVALVQPAMVVGAATTEPDCKGKHPKPMGRAAVLDFAKTFYDGKNPRKLRNTCDINFRVTVDRHNHLQEIKIYGDSLKIHLSKGLVQPVFRNDNRQWERNGKRLSFNIGDRVLTLKKSRLPTWGGVIELDSIPVVITSSNIVGRLNKVDLGGTPQKPLIIFDDVEII